jgi:hypothetical protein
MKKVKGKKGKSEILKRKSPIFIKIWTSEFLDSRFRGSVSCSEKIFYKTTNRTGFLSYIIGDYNNSIVDTDAAMKYLQKTLFFQSRDDGNYQNS